MFSCRCLSNVHWSSFLSTSVSGETLRGCRRTWVRTKTPLYGTQAHTWALSSRTKIQSQGSSRRCERLKLTSIWSIEESYNWHKWRTPCSYSSPHSCPAMDNDGPPLAHRRHRQRNGLCEADGRSRMSCNTWVWSSEHCLSHINGNEALLNLSPRSRSTEVWPSSWMSFSVRIQDRWSSLCSTSTEQ